MRLENLFNKSFREGAQGVLLFKFFFRQVEGLNFYGSNYFQGGGRSLKCHTPVREGRGAVGVKNSEKASAVKYLNDPY